MVFHKRVHWVLLTVLVIAAPSLAADPFLIFHLDGVPANMLFEELDSGRLPAIATVFSGGGRIDRALSLFPGGTEMIYPRLKQGHDSSIGLPIAWASYDRHCDKEVGRVRNFLTMASFFPRQARYQLVEGFGRADWSAGLAMQNLPRFVGFYPVTEFFWFPTDGAGHMSGKEAMLDSLHRFDSNLTKLLPFIEQEKLNILLYCDHGMAFSKQELDFADILADLVGPEVKYYMYPNIYLCTPERRAEIATLLAKHSKVSFAFYRENPTTVCGVSQSATLKFSQEGAGITYEWWGENDPLGYAATHSLGESLTDEQWLDSTAEAHMPGVPVQIYRYLSNPNTGDVVVVFNPPWRDVTPSCREGGHLGLTAEDLMVGVLYRGPAFSGLQGKTSIWLNTLYSNIGELNLTSAPERETHSLNLHLGPRPVLEAAISPGYRWLMSASSTKGLAVDYDLFTTYLGRLWGGYDGALRVTSELFFGRWTMTWRFWPQMDEDEGAISYQVSKDLSATWTFGKGIGLSIKW